MFAALYLAFLGQPSGPRAGWLLASLPAGLRRRAAPGRRRAGYAHRMISIQLIRDDPDAVKRAIARKGEATEAVDRLAGRGRPAP